MAEVRLNDVQKVYPNGFKAIHGIDIDITDGEFIVLVGPSGCGKSTLLRMIAGLETVSDGEIHIGERMVNQLEPADRDIAMVFQNYALYPHMSCYDNMAYGLRNKGMPKDEIEKRVREAAEILELAQLLDRRPRQLSGGQRQRIAMGRAIVREPSVFLFDEPLSNLDAKLRVQMRVEIRKLQRNLGTTSVYVTHDQVEAMTMADRLVVMNEGVAEQIGTPIEVYERPATMFVAGFIGSPAMNFMDAKVEGEEVIVGGKLHFPMPNGTGALEAGREVSLGIRPEHLDLGGNGDVGLPIKVELVEHLGADTLVYGYLPWDTQNLVTLRMQGSQEFPAGHEITLTVSHDHLHLFDKQSGKRI